MIRVLLPCIETDSCIWKKGTLASFDTEKEKKNNDRWDLKWQRAPKWAVPRPVRYIARISPQTHQLDPYLIYQLTR